MSLPGAQFSARVVDNLGQPVAGALVKAHCLEIAAGRYRDHELFNVKSGSDGGIAGSYNEPKPQCAKAINIERTANYEGRRFEAFHAVYVVRRFARAEEIHKIVQLEDSKLRPALRVLLTSALDGWLERDAFYYEDRLRPALRALAEDPDPDASIPARTLLAFIGVPDDLRLIASLQQPRQEGDLVSSYRWLYGVNCSLLEPTSEAEWNFLRMGALGQYGKGWAVGGATQSLKLIASARSREILEEVSRADPSRARSISSAIQYIDSAPAPLRDQSLDEVSRRLGQILGPKTWTGNQPPYYNKMGDKALANLNFAAGVDIYVYTAVLHHVDGSWIVRGVRETMQATSR